MGIEQELDEECLHDLITTIDHKNILMNYLNSDMESFQVKKGIKDQCLSEEKNNSYWFNDKTNHFNQANADRFIHLNLAV